MTLLVCLFLSLSHPSWHFTLRFTNKICFFGPHCVSFDFIFTSPLHFLVLFIAVGAIFQLLFYLYTYPCRFCNLLLVICLCDWSQRACQSLSVFNFNWYLRYYSRFGNYEILCYVFEKKGKIGYACKPTVYGSPLVHGEGYIRALKKVWSKDPKHLGEVWSINRLLWYPLGFWTANLKKFCNEFRISAKFDEIKKKVFINQNWLNLLMYTNFFCQEAHDDSCSSIYLLLIPSSKKLIFVEMKRVKLTVKHKHIIFTCNKYILNVIFLKLVMPQNIFWKNSERIHNSPKILEKNQNFWLLNTFQKFITKIPNSLKNSWKNSYLWSLNTPKDS